MKPPTQPQPPPPPNQPPPPNGRDQTPGGAHLSGPSSFQNFLAPPNQTMYGNPYGYGNGFNFDTQMMNSYGYGNGYNSGAQTMISGLTFLLHALRPVITSQQVEHHSTGEDAMSDTVSDLDTTSSDEAHSEDDQYPKPQSGNLASNNTGIAFLPNLLARSIPSSSPISVYVFVSFFYLPIVISSLSPLLSPSSLSSLHLLLSLLPSLFPITLVPITALLTQAIMQVMVMTLDGSSDRSVSTLKIWVSSFSVLNFLPLSLQIYFYYFYLKIFIIFINHSYISCADEFNDVNLCDKCVPALHKAIAIAKSGKNLHANIHSREKN
jgi:hypothetical protein